MTQYPTAEMIAEAKAAFEQGDGLSLEYRLGNVLLAMRAKEQSHSPALREALADTRQRWQQLYDDEKLNAGVRNFALGSISRIDSAAHSPTGETAEPSWRSADTYELGQVIFNHLHGFLRAAGINGADCKLTITVPTDEDRKMLTKRLQNDMGERGSPRSAARIGNSAGTWQGIAYEFATLSPTEATGDDVRGAVQYLREEMLDAEEEGEATVRVRCDLLRTAIAPNGVSQSAVERLRYFVNNPSAWENYDESVSEAIRAALATQPDTGLREALMQARPYVEQASFRHHDVSGLLAKIDEALSSVGGEG